MLKTAVSIHEDDISGQGFRSIIRDMDVMGAATLDMPIAIQLDVDPVVNFRRRR